MSNVGMELLFFRTPVGATRFQELASLSIDSDGSPLQKLPTPFFVC